jgi:short chain dehydrogenase/Domain of unknown function (DUF4263)
LRVHLGGPVNTVKAAWPHMIAQRYGKIILVTSFVGLFGLRGQATYAAAKSAVVGLMRADGGLQIVELKGPAERIIEKHRNHYIVSASVHRAVSQCINYLRALDEQGAMLQTTYRSELNLDIDFRRVGGTVVIGHPGRGEASSPSATKAQIEQTIRSYNAHIARIQVVTYSDLLGSANRALRF